MLGTIDAAQAVKAVRRSDRPAAFTISLADGRNIELVPVNEIVDEAYGVYFQTTTK